MQKINSLIVKTAKKYKIYEKTSGYKACGAWERVITGLYPSAIGKTIVVSLEKGILRIAALSKEIADFIIIYSKRIINEVNQCAGRAVVFKIVCEYC